MEVYIFSENLFVLFTMGLGWYVKYSLIAQVSVIRKAEDIVSLSGFEFWTEVIKV